jgi:hypothetical protein
MLNHPSRVKTPLEYQVVAVADSEFGLALVESQQVSPTFTAAACQLKVVSNIDSDPQSTYCV